MFKLQTCVGLLQVPSPGPGTGNLRIRPSSWPLGAYILVKLMDMCTAKSTVHGSEGVEDPAGWSRQRGIREVFPRGTLDLIPKNEFTGGTSRSEWGKAGPSESCMEPCVVRRGR